MTDLIKGILRGIISVIGFLIVGFFLLIVVFAQWIFEEK